RSRAHRRDCGRAAWCADISWDDLGVFCRSAGKPDAPNAPPYPSHVLRQAGTSGQVPAANARDTPMIAPDLETAVDRLRALVATSNVIVPFTGAGISTECGIPDFRSPGGIWSRMAPIPFDEFLATQAARDESWRRRFAMQEHFGAARPGRGHRALASLFRSGKSPGVVTQNIDNLHQASGIPHPCVIELHGNTTYAVCLECAKRYELDWVREQFDHTGRAPDCPD